MSDSFLLFGQETVYPNYGCEAIVRGTEHVLKASFPDADVVHASKVYRDFDTPVMREGSGVRIANYGNRWNPAFFFERLSKKLKLSNKLNLHAPRKLVRQSSCVLSVGGDTYTFPEKERNWNRPYDIINAGNEVIRMGVPYVIWCASVGPFDKAGNRLGEIVEHLNNCTAIIVREKESYRYLREDLNITNNLHLAADPAFLMEPHEMEAPFLTEPGDPVLAVNFTGSSFEYFFGPEGVADKIPASVELLSKVISNFGVRVLLTPHCVGDVVLLGEIYKQLAARHKDRVWILPASARAREVKWAVSKCAALVTMRFHCALAGLGTCVPTLVLVSQPKATKMYMDMFGNLDWATDMRDIWPLDTGRLEEERLLGQIKNLLENKDVLKNQLQEELKDYKDRALSASSYLHSVLKP